VLAGQGRDQAALEKQAENLGLKQVVFTGHISDRDLLDGLYMAADLFVFPSIYDTAGLVVREAAVMGTPSVVVENTAPAEVIQPGVTGLVCQDNSESLCRVVEHYLLELSDEQRKALGLQAQKNVPLPWETVMAEVQERYHSLIESRKFSVFTD
jgi:glycosyltransferase involved in cell wall biosynthesis